MNTYGEKWTEVFFSNKIGQIHQTKQISWIEFQFRFNFALNACNTPHRKYMRGIGTCHWKKLMNKQTPITFLIDFIHENSLKMLLLVPLSTDMFLRCQTNCRSNCEKKDNVFYIPICRPLDSDIAIEYFVSKCAQCTRRIHCYDQFIINRAIVCECGRLIET